MAKISDGNMKLGKIPNVSLTPCKACSPDAPCKKKCYAMKAYRMYPLVRKAWDINTKEVATNREKYFADIRKFLAKKKPKYFRWHVAGDIPDVEYLGQMIQIAYEFRETKFLAFTKRHDIIEKYFGDDAPLNLEIVMSMWPGWGKATAGKAQGFRRAWMQDGTETRVPKDAIECPGFCENCGMCWSLGKLGRDVVFNAH
jgi:hypothetical protein